jgi:hypothetical protein
MRAKQGRVHVKTVTERRGDCPDTQTGPYRYTHPSPRHGYPWRQLHMYTHAQGLFVFFFLVMGFELRAYTLSHSTSPVL